MSHPQLTREQRRLQLRSWLRSAAGRERLCDRYKSAWDLDHAVEDVDDAAYVRMIQAILASEFPYWETKAQSEADELP